MAEVVKKKRLFMSTYCSDGVPAGYEIASFVYANNIREFPCKVNVRYKVGKRRKVSKMRIVAYSAHRCETCGSHTYIDLFIHGKNVYRET